MADYRLVCTRCGEKAPWGPTVTGCLACAGLGSVGVLEATIDLPAAAPRPRDRPPAPALVRYADLLPGGDPARRVTLGEGGTALVPSRVIGPRLGLTRLFFKNETSPR